MARFKGTPVEPEKKGGRFGGTPVADKKAWQPRKRTVDDLRQAARVQDSTDGMSPLEVFAAGAGKSLVDTGRGLKQLWNAGLDAVAPRQRTTSDLVTGRDPSRYAESMREQDDIDERDGSLMGNGYGLAGNITGSVAQVLSPAVVLKGMATVPALARAAPTLNTAARAALPSTIKGAAAQGGVLGLVQPVGSDDSRLLNAAAGTAFGAAGAAIPRAAGAVYRAARGSLMTGSGANRRLAEILRSEAENPAALMTPQPSAIPGVQRTLAEETLDPGIARLERNARSTGRGFDTLDRTNNAARVAAIRQFAGDEAAVEAAKDARGKATAPLYAAADKVTGVDTTRLLSQIERLSAAQEGRPAVQNGLGAIAKLLTGNDSMRTLSNVRLTIGDMLSGNYGGDSGRAMAGSRALMAVKDQLDRVAAKASPEFAQGTQAFRQHSADINRMQIGQSLIGQRSGSAVLDPVTGEQVLLPAAFSNRARNLDKVAAEATGFRKAKAANYLTPDDLATISAVQDDLQRKAFAASAGSGGNSQTFERMALNDRVAGGVMAKLPFGVGKAFEYLDAMGQQRLRTQLSEVLTNPQQARALLARIPPNDRRVIEDALAASGGALGATALPAVE